MKRIKDYYPDGVCPNCGEPISDYAKENSECGNCEHVFSENESLFDYYILRMEKRVTPNLYGPYNNVLTQEENWESYIDDPDYSDDTFIKIKISHGSSIDLSII